MNDRGEASFDLVYSPSLTTTWRPLSSPLLFALNVIPIRWVPPLRLGCCLRPIVTTWVQLTPRQASRWHEVLFLWCKWIYLVTLMEFTGPWWLQKHHGIITKLSIKMCNSLHIDSADTNLITEMPYNKVIYRSVWWLTEWYILTLICLAYNISPCVSQGMPRHPVGFKFV
jgi:hypothetical protein